MRKTNALTKKQREVIEDIFTSKLDQQAVLEKHKVSPILYSKWHNDGVFIEYFEKRIASAHRQGAAVIASKASDVANNLVELTKGKQGETARKACLDIIAMQKPEPTPQAEAQPTPQIPDQPQKLNKKTAEKILKILAQENQTPDDES
jgi:hypothetical protein